MAWDTIWQWGEYSTDRSQRVTLRLLVGSSLVGRGDPGDPGEGGACRDVEQHGAGQRE